MDTASLSQADTAPIIVTATMGAADFAWADALRRAHFPPERNLLPAHLTLFRHLPPSVGAEVLRRMADLCAGPPPPARIVGVMDLGAAWRCGSKARRFSRCATRWPGRCMAC